MSTRRFDYFAVLAGMRTGSNLLEESLNAMPGIVSHGELFNPHFFGKPGETSKFGLSLSARDADPLRVIGAMRSNSDGLPGFRLFYDHDSRALEAVLNDPRAAKIVLSRRPIDSYVSLKIARKTNQWWLGDMASARAAKVPFDAEEYVEFLTTLTGFQQTIARGLQTTGQTAFHIAYEDLADSDILDGLGRFLGAAGPLDPEKVRAKVQNPTRLSERLTNDRHAEDALRHIATPDIGYIPHHEPGRGPGLKFFRACKDAPLLYMPIRGAGSDPIPDWLTDVDPGGEVEAGMSQKDLRRWKRTHPGHRAFTVIRHPLTRAYDAFCRCILPADIESHADLRTALIERYDVPLPPDGPCKNYCIETHRSAFLAFLQFLKGNLGGQTSIRVDNSWATQAVLLHAIGEFAIPDRVIREDAMPRELAQLAIEVGIDADGPESGFEAPAPFLLADVRTSEIDGACEAAYRRDYMMFGFSDWRDV